MNEVYDEAALRHYHDGELLRRERRVANADQLYGFAAECAIKSVLVRLPGCANNGELAEGYYKHVDRLWDLAPVQSIQRRHPKLASLLKNFRPFEDWSTRQRYFSDDAIAEPVLGSHRTAARRVLGSVQLLGSREEA